MKSILQIEELTKEEFIQLIEETVEKKVSTILKKEDQKYLSVELVSKKLGFSKLTIYTYLKKGIIPAKKIGRKYLINSNDLDQILAEVKSLRYKR